MAQTTQTMISWLTMSNEYKTSAIVLGMHDALVSQTGIITGLAFSLADSRLIIMTAIISAVADGLSMMASNYLAECERSMRKTAVYAGLYTGAAYLGTSALLIIPFFITENTNHAIVASFIIAAIVIFLFNWCTARNGPRKLWRNFFEMLGICASVSFVAYFIGIIAKKVLGI